MRFACDNCRAQYMISDDWVGPKGVKVRCKKCGQIIIVRPAGSRPEDAKDAGNAPAAVTPIGDDAAVRKEPPTPETPGSSLPREHVFISYSHRDKKWLERIQMHLKPLVRAQSLKVWSDTNIKAGDDWRKELEAALAQSKVAVLLVSASFLASDFVAHNELPALLNREGVPVLWIPISACLYESVGIDKYQAVIDPSRPLNKLHHAHVDEALVKICREIQKAYSKA